MSKTSIFDFVKQNDLELEIKKTGYVYSVRIKHLETKITKESKLLATPYAVAESESLALKALCEELSNKYCVYEAFNVKLRREFVAPNLHSSINTSNIVQYLKVLNRIKTVFFKEKKKSI
jgi:hypothetical protein